METIDLYKIYVKQWDEEVILPKTWTIKLKGKTISFFVRGIGYTTSKKFEKLDKTIPEYEKLSWFEIAKLTHKYGKYVGEYLANRKTAGIVAMQTALGYSTIYGIIKDIIPENFDEKFFECLKANYMLACFGKFLFDIVATDIRLAELVPEYDHERNTYNNEINVSMSAFITKHFGEAYAKIIEKLNE